MSTELNVSWLTGLLEFRIPSISEALRKTLRDEVEP